MRKLSENEDEGLGSAASAPSQEGMGGSFEADGPMETSPEEVAELRAQAEKAAENWDKYVRLNADFENFKKRAARERQEAIRYANEGLFEKLIPILDNFEMAMQAANAPQASAAQAKGSQGQAASASAQGGAADALKQGVNMIASQLKSALNEAGLEEIDATGQVFNPNLHEAVSQQESKDVPEGRVLQQLRKGYRLRDRLVRPATVIVSKKAGA